MHITIDARNRVAGFANFWNGTGMSGRSKIMPAYDEPVVRANVTLIGAIPHGGCRWNRPHSLLRYVWVRGLDTDAPEFDFTDFDAAIDPIIAAGQRLWFECMGLPRGGDHLLTDFREPGQQALWRTLLTAALRHLIERHGVETLRGWHFEAWNEADNPVSKSPHHWKAGEALAHYRTTVAALTALDPALRVGGPGSGGGIDNDHYRTFVREGLPQNDGFRLDYLSFHHKATPRQQREVAARARAEAAQVHPRGADILLVNDEADADWNWDQALAHRGRPAYASFIARQVIEFQLALRAGESPAGPGPAYLLFNDNAFLGDWGNRTQFTWYGDAHRFALIKKPAHNVMSLLALQGDEQIEARGATIDDPVGVIAARRGADEVTILLCRWDDALMSPSAGDAPAVAQPEDVAVTLDVRGLPFTAGAITHYRIDDAHGNTQAIWRELGMPYEPDQTQLARLRAEHELTPMAPREPLSGDAVRLSLSLPVPAVHLVVIRAARAETLPPPAGLTARVFPGLHRQREDVLLAWPADVRGVASYRVEKAPSEHGPWQALATPELVCGSYVDAVPRGERPWYRVVSVDDTGRAGEPGGPVQAKAS